MKTIWKYKLNVNDYNAVIIPKGAIPLSVQVQDEVVCLWCLINPDEKENEERLFRMVGTGHLIEDKKLNYIGTFQLYNGGFVGHLFEVLR